MNRFIKDPAACAHPGSPVLNDLIYGWGNEAWSARDEFLAGCIEQALASNGAILECGSGLTTVLLGVITKQQGQSHWVLEHKPEWAKKVRKYVTLYGLDSVICASPLKDYGEYCWYDTSFERLPDRFSLVVCDGPPSRTKGGRYGLAPVMGGRLNPGCAILLDDAGRPAELEIAQRWQNELNAPFNVRGLNKPYIKMTLGFQCITSSQVKPN